jgi:hypothetical protein
MASGEVETADLPPLRAAGDSPGTSLQRAAHGEPDGRNTLELGAGAYERVGGQIRGWLAGSTCPPDMNQQAGRMVCARICARDAARHAETGETQ